MTFADKDACTLPACLIIMDGFGLADPGSGNAISLANTPHLDELFATCPHIELDASGKPVGLPEGQMGNSEVGHLQDAPSTKSSRVSTMLARAGNSSKTR